MGVNTSEPIADNPGDAREIQLADYLWCQQQAEILKGYGGQVVAVSRRKLWGHGLDHIEAMSSALRALANMQGSEDVPSAEDLVFVTIPEPYREGDDDLYPC